MSAETKTLLTPEALLRRDGISIATDFYQFRTLLNLLTREELAALKNYVPSLLPFYLSELNALNPASFYYLNPAQKRARLEKLKLTYFLLYAQYQLDSSYDRQYNLHQYKESLDQCAHFIDQLTILSEKENEPLTLQHEIEQAWSEKYLKFSGLLVGKWLAERLAEFYGITNIEEDSKDPDKQNEAQYKADRDAFAGLQGIEAGKVAQNEFQRGNTAFIRKWMGAVNERRLYWVWGGGMLSSVLDLLPDDFLNKQQTQAAVSSPSPFTGYMSWLLYYARFGVNMTLVLKHTFIGPWMTKKEKKAAELTTPWHRFTSELKDRKFALLNDSLWATANLLCFFWLKGPGWLGWGGNVATAVLLAMDLVLTVIRYFEEETAHRKHIAMLQGTIHSLANSPGNEERIAELEKAIVQAEFDWKYKKYGTLNDIAYSAGLLAAFALVCCGFAPPGLIAASTLIIVAAVGAALCFALTVIYSAVTSGIAIAKTKATAQQIKDQYNQCFSEFERLNTLYTEKTKQLNSQPLIELHDLSELERELHIHYLMLKDFEADVDYQNRTARFQSVKLVRSIFIDACIPALIFASFTFMPLPIAIAVLAAGLLLAGLSYVLINRFEPKPTDKAVLDGKENEFENFSKNPVNAFSKKTKASEAGMFSHAGNRQATQDDKALLVSPQQNNDPNQDYTDLITFD